jgi:hypothetical protein
MMSLIKGNSTKNCDIFENSQFITGPVLPPGHNTASNYFSIHPNQIPSTSRRRQYVTPKGGTNFLSYTV